MLGDSTIYPLSCICSNHLKEGDISQEKKKTSWRKNATPLLSTLGEYEYKSEFTVLFNLVLIISRTITHPVFFSELQ